MTPEEQQRARATRPTDTPAHGTELPPPPEPMQPITVVVQWNDSMASGPYEFEEVIHADLLPGGNSYFIVQEDGRRWILPLQAIRSIELCPQP